MTCESHRDALLDVLYGEADPVVARRVDEHLASCGDCRDELASLREVRGDLARWELPSGLRGPQPAARPVWRRGWWPPAAAAAVLLLALGGALGLSGSELRYEEGRVSFRLGRGASSPPPSLASRDLEARLLALEARHQETLLAVKALAATPPAPGGEHLLPRMERLIADSEARQALLLEARLEDQVERAEQQRRYDLAQVSAGLSYLDGKTGLQVARTTQLMGQILQASEKR
jgi:hypothetical protein